MSWRSNNSRPSSAKSNKSDRGSTCSIPFSIDELPRRKIVVVGDGMAGKTSLLYKQMNGECPEDHIPTIMENSTTIVEARDLDDSFDDSKPKVTYMSHTKSHRRCKNFYIVPE